jgi:AGCS family alanine or glycine:cation symporter
VNEAKAVLDFLNELLWASPSDFPFMVVFLLGTGIFLTLRLGFLQLRKLGHSVKVIMGAYDDPEHPGEVSHFHALSAALSATVGIGNIAGVALAVHYGGPGALFWMWVTAFLGMATKYTECTLALRYRKVEDGVAAGGPMYYMKYGLGNLGHGVGKFFTFMAPVFAVSAVIAAMGIGNSIQANTLADAMHSSFAIPTVVTGLVSTAIVGAVILGGIKRIASASVVIVPLMAFIYVGGSLLILGLHYDAVPGAFLEIITGAFNPPAAIGGFAGSTFIMTMLWGVKRGLFSNEAGQGSSPIAHAAARTDKPVREGVVALMEPFIDTIIICTMTGLVIVATGVWKEKKDESLNLGARDNLVFFKADADLGPGAALDPAAKLDLLTITAGSPQAQLLRNNSIVDHPRFTLADGKAFTGTLRFVGDQPTYADAAGLPVPSAQVTYSGATLTRGAPLTAFAFDRGLDFMYPWGGYLVAISILLFAISTAISWSYYGDRCMHFLFGPKSVLPYRIVYLIVHFLGAIFSLELVWAFGDFANAMMALPNLVAILLLSGKVAHMSKDYFAEMKRGKK